MYYGSAEEQIEAMIASDIPIPKELQYKPTMPKRMNFIQSLFWELNTERAYFAFGGAQPIPSSLIDLKLKEYGFMDYQIGELKAILTKLDKEFRRYDTAQLKHNGSKSDKSASKGREEYGEYRS